MEGSVEYDNIWKEDRGAINIGRMKINDQGIIFKSNKTGKVEHFPKSDFRELLWHRLPTCCCVRLMLDNGQITRFMGFKENDFDKLRNYMQTNFDIELKPKDLCLRGWNWGTAEFKGSVLSFDVEGKSAFEIPLNYVSHCTSAKNEVVLEFHQNDTAAVSLMELRFHLPASGDGVDHRVTAFTDAVLSKANIIQATGDAICTFSELQCLTPRGRYDIKIFPGFIQLHGKTFDYKISVDAVLRLFRLPHKDGRQVFFVFSLDPPIKQGQTRYHFLILLFNKEDEVHVELSLSERELQEKYEGRLEKENRGPTVDILGKIMKAIVGRKITVPGALTASGNPAISCSYRAGAGLLYLLERGFIYVHKPPVHIRFDEISSINFARSGGSTRSFDFEVETKSGQVHTFSSIEKEEYQKIYDFVSSKKLRVKNRGTEPAASATIDDDLIDSDEEEEPDAYLARVKHEGKIREEEGDSDESDESFNPDASEGSDAGSGDAGSASSGSSGSSDISSDSDASAEEETPKKKAKPKSKPKEKTKEKKETKKRGKEEKDKNAPKKPLSAYFIWLGENREKIKQKNPGISVTEISKKGGEMWREVKDKSEWEKKAQEAKRKYQEALSDYKASGGGDSGSRKKGDSPKKSKTSKPGKSSQSSKKKVASPTKSSGVFKSREYIDSDDDSSSDDSSGKAAKKGAKKSKKDSDVEMASEATASTPASSESESD